LEPRAFRIEVDSRGKPGLVGAQGGPGIHFNIAHSGSACVIALSARGPVGVDVEIARERTHMERIVRRRFAPVEAAEILSLTGEERRRAFYRVWTRKEAYLKATGIGLEAELDSFAVSAGAEPTLISQPAGQDAHWTLADLDLGPGLQGALATSGKPVGMPRSIHPPLLPM